LAIPFNAKCNAFEQKPFHALPFFLPSNKKKMHFLLPNDLKNTRETRVVHLATPFEKINGHYEIKIEI